jgi:ribonuclease Z
MNRVVFLGTGSAVPSTKRNVSSIVLCLSSGVNILVDCGEGTQHQLQKSSIKPGKINYIFLTHLHGDHCYGIFGLISTLNMNSRKDPLYVYGPIGVKKMIQTVFSLSTAGEMGFDLIIKELDPACVHELLDIPSFTVHACPIVHTMPCLGYVFKEPLNAPKLLVEKAKSSGAKIEHFKDLKLGRDVVLDDGRVIRGRDCLDSENVKPSRALAVMQDTSDPSMAVPFMEHVDFLIHECTYDKSMREKALEFGHSTSEMAAEVAVACHAKTLILTHFSSRIDDFNALKEEAGQIFNGKILIAEDLMEIPLPHD